MSSSENWLRGGGEMGARIRAFDWSATSLGAPDTWSPALRTMVRILLANRFPQLLWWGPDYIQFYNDPYRPIPGTKHPHKALGRPARECWSEIWHVIGPLIDTPFSGGPATWNDDIELEIERHGYREESHFTIAYSPVPDDTVPTGIGGVLATVHEITEKVIAERRTAVLRDLGAHVGEARTASDACDVAAAALSDHAKDLPFALIYLIDENGTRATLCGSAGVAPGQAISPMVIDLEGNDGSAWPLADVLATQSPQIVERIGEQFAHIPRGPWSDPPHTAVAIPIPTTKAHELAGFLIAGLSSRLAFDRPYQDFLNLVRTQVATVIAHARAYEEERKRAEALAEIDRAKTQFFSNVSHEFRTPLTLMLGPVEDMLEESSDLPEADRARLDTVHRNSIRLLKLVNTLLDFSRIEAGRAMAAYEAVDLAAFTAELASSFRSACQRAGLELVVGCEPLPKREQVWVDREMWEKIVLNLLSNAFKFTLEGQIEVRVDSAGGQARLRVRDTGMGIPADELPRIFDRFHRTHSARGRTHEGTGIGLSLVQELVKLHGGTVSVDSAPNRGSVFTVTIPLGNAHLDPAQLRTTPSADSTRTSANAYVQEALRWLPDDVRDDASEAQLAAVSGLRPRVLWADDNADMRDYVTRLLSDRFEVEAVSDGQEALDTVRVHPPDIVVTDVMMPRLDGFGLLKEMRADPALRDIPVIMLSARAGEEARIEGIDAGADDYLIKPFSARELVARVDARLELSKARRLHSTSLEKALAERTEEVIRAERALATAERMASVGTLSAGIGHDMANLLMPVRVRLETLSAMSLPPNAAKELAGIKSSTDYLQRLAIGLRLLAVDPNRMRMAESTELHAWWSEAAPVLKSTLGMGVALRSELPEGECWLAVSRPALMQAVFNLVQNAGDAMRDQPSGTVTVKAKAHDDGVDIVVSDTGPGMSEDVKRRCMEPFYTTKAREISTGLGLALVYGIVRDAGGTVDLDSIPGRGTTFTLRLKRGNRLPVAMTGVRRRAHVAVRDERMRAIIAAELQTLSYEVRFDAESAANADLVVADRHDVPRSGKVVLLTGTDHAPAFAVALGDKPKVSAIREALHRLSAGA